MMFIMAYNRGVEKGSTYDEARTRKLNAEAEIAEIELEKIKGSLVIAADVVTAWENVLGAMKGKLLSLPTKAAPIVAAETDAGGCQQILESILSEALEELSNYDPAINAGDTKRPVVAPEDGDFDTEAPAKVKRKPVGRPKKTARLSN